MPRPAAGQRCQSPRARISLDEMSRIGMLHEAPGRRIAPRQQPRLGRRQPGPREDAAPPADHRAESPCPGRASTPTGTMLDDRLPVVPAVEARRGCRPPSARRSAPPAQRPHAPQRLGGVARAQPRLDVADHHARMVDQSPAPRRAAAPAAPAPRPSAGCRGSPATRPGRARSRPAPRGVMWTWPSCGGSKEPPRRPTACPARASGNPARPVSTSRPGRGTAGLGPPFGEPLGRPCGRQRQGPAGPTRPPRPMAAGSTPPGRGTAEEDPDIGARHRLRRRASRRPLSHLRTIAPPRPRATSAPFCPIAAALSGRPPAGALFLASPPPRCTIGRTQRGAFPMRSALTALAAAWLATLPATAQQAADAITTEGTSTGLIEGLSDRAAAALQTRETGEPVDAPTTGWSPPPTRSRSRPAPKVLRAGRQRRRRDDRRADRAGPGRAAILGPRRRRLPGLVRRRMRRADHARRPRDGAARRHAAATSRTTHGEPLDFYDAVVGGRSVGTPGTPALMQAAHDRWGKLDWASALRRAPSPWPRTASSSRRAWPSLVADEPEDRLPRFEATAAYFYPGGERHRRRATPSTNQAYADTLRAIAEGGARGLLHRRRSPQDIVDTVQGAEGNPGLLSMTDLAALRGGRAAGGLRRLPRAPRSAAWARPRPAR